MPRPVCVCCRKEMRCSKNGRAVLTTTDGNPYQLWEGDEYECRECGHRVVVGFGLQPIAEHFEEKMKPWLERERKASNLVEVSA